MPRPTIPDRGTTHNNPIKTTYRSCKLAMSGTKAPYHSAKAAFAPVAPTADADFNRFAMPYCQKMLKADHTQWLHLVGNIREDPDARRATDD